MKIKSLLTLILVLTLNAAMSAPSEANYYRFWRGAQRADLTSAQFEKALNEKLLPATGVLFSTAVGIKSYQPVLLDRGLAHSGKYPVETALLTYRSEAEYRAYRATAEGQAYGDLHFEMFEKSTSGSLVPELYQGTVKIEGAYDLVGKDVDWNVGMSRFKVYSRSGSFSDAQYLQSIQQHIEHMTQSGPSAAVILVAHDYVLEYTLWNSRASLEKANRTIIESLDPQTGRRITTVLDDLVEVTSRTDMDIELKRGNWLRAGQGVRYLPVLPSL